MKRVLALSAAAAVAVLSLASQAVAHHAMEYIELESYTTARQGEWVFHLHYDYMVDDGDAPQLDHWELTPGFSYGIRDRLMFDIHTHFAKFGTGHVVADRIAEFGATGPSPFLEAAAASLQYRVTEGQVADVAVVGTVELPFGRAEDVLGSEDMVFAGLLIVGKELDGHRNVTANLGYEVEGDESDFHWGLAAKTPISPESHGIAAGVELMGSFEEPGDNWAILPGVYMPLGAQNITLKTGLEFGKSDGADALRANLTLMYRF